VNEDLQLNSTSTQTSRDLTPHNKTIGVRPNNVKKRKFSDELTLPEFDPSTWNYVNNKWSDRISSLSTYRCWKCKKVGHLPIDCTQYINVVTQSTAEPSVFNQPDHPEHATKKGKATPYSRKLRKLFQKCQAIAKKRMYSVLLVV